MITFTNSPWGEGAGLASDPTEFTGVWCEVGFGFTSLGAWASGVRDSPWKKVTVVHSVFSGCSRSSGRPWGWIMDVLVHWEYQAQVWSVPGHLGVTTNVTSASRAGNGDLLSQELH